MTTETKIPETTRDAVVQQLMAADAFDVRRIAAGVRVSVTIRGRTGIGVAPTLDEAYAAARVDMEASR